MRRLTLREWLGTSVCAAVMMAGCSSAQRQPAYSNRSVTSVSMLPGYTPGTVFTTSPVQSTASKPMATASLPAPATEPQVEKEMKTEMKTEALPLANVATAPAKEVETIPTVAKSSDQEATPAGYSIRGGQDEMLRRRSYADITAKACFSHAPDYTWVQGELVYLHSHNCWRIRYASVDEDDKYGGGINLVETGPMENFKDGQCVRVQGHPADPENKESEYRVTSIQALPNQ
jgi:hypothetical protein